MWTNIALLQICLFIIIVYYLISFRPFSSNADEYISTDPDRSVTTSHLSVTHLEFISNRSSSLVVIVVDDAGDLGLQSFSGAVETWIADAYFPVVLFSGLNSGQQMTEGKVYALNAIAKKTSFAGALRGRDVSVWETVFLAGKHYDFALIVNPKTYVNLGSIISLTDYLASKRHFNHYVGLPRGQTCSKDSGGLLLGKQFIETLEFAFKEEKDLSAGRIYDRVGAVASRVAWLKCSKAFQDTSASHMSVVNQYLLQKDGAFALPSFVMDMPWVYPIGSYKKFRKIHAQVQYYLRPVIGFAKESLLSDIPVDTCINNPSMELHHVPGRYLPECSSLSQPQIPAVKDIPTYILNLPDEKEQFLSTASAFERVGIKAKRFEGIKGTALDPESLKALSQAKILRQDEKSSFLIDFPLNSFPKPFEMTADDVPFDRLDISPMKKRSSSLKAGEVGYRLSMQQLLLFAHQQKIPYMLVMDDDAVPYCDFETAWKKLTSCSRCSSVFADYRQQRGRESKTPAGHGILMLGAAVWNEGTYPNLNGNDYFGGWKMAYHDIANHTINSMCYNLNNRTFGSFGVIYPYSSYELILDWMDKENKPFDWVFEYLAIQGYPVRISFPNLIIQNVGHQSRVDPKRKNTENVSHRAKLHRWNLAKYCLESGKSLGQIYST